MATHSSILTWEIPWTEELGGLYSPWESDMSYWLNNIIARGAVTNASIYFPIKDASKVDNIAQLQEL